MKRQSESVKIRFKKLANGKQSIYLDYWNAEKQQREYDFLKLYLLKGNTPVIKEQNKVTLRTVQAIQTQKIIDLANGKIGIKDSKKDKVLLNNYFEQFVDSQKKTLAPKTIQLYNIVNKHLRDYNSNLTIGGVTKKVLLGFTEYLKINGVSSNSIIIYNSKFRKVMEVARKRGIILSNPFDLLETVEKPKKIQAKRDYLTESELKQFIEIGWKYEEVKRAFLFSCYTGLRYIDIECLKWSDIDFNTSTITIYQQKTKELLTVNLSNKAKSFLVDNGKLNVFDLPARMTIHSQIVAISKQLGITKRVSFHTARHTFATLLLTKGVDLYTTSKLLGHTDIKTTQIYADIVNEKKQNAVDLLND